MHVFETLHVCLNNHDGCYSGVQHKACDFTISVGVVKLSGVCYSGVSNVLKSIEKPSRLKELSVIAWVSTIEGCPLSRVPLYMKVYNMCDNKYV